MARYLLLTLVSVIALLLIITGCPGTTTINTTTEDQTQTITETQTITQTETQVLVNITPIITTATTTTITKTPTTTTNIINTTVTTTNITTSTIKTTMTTTTMTTTTTSTNIVTTTITTTTIVVIIDKTGYVWDVTHAMNVYGMNPEFFNFGLGIGAIPSIDNPTILEEGDPGYPSPDSTIAVFGVSHNGENRAYSVETLRHHEVVNDIYPGETNQYLAVTFCPLANYAAAFNREIDGSIIALTTSGWTYGQNIGSSTFVLADKGTRSLWFPSGSSLLCIGGAYADSILDGNSLSATTWAQWKSAHPDTKYVTD